MSSILVALSMWKNTLLLYYVFIIYDLEEYCVLLIVVKEKDKDMYP